ncbi:MAG: flagellar basal body rod C-terminal domain-containing protein [Oceanibaculum nanhaiense]|uniref:flagellar basal body rod C-terminal domain-containing protein n=1 Tax=Oceanibaculum nanhaiense TaxID=1909734 RepID=UPI0025A389C3|nr:flagellar basal body rod C-terminal domain-containing protein [Oceanibaculum nanhaiense]MDM7947963.1 flagellar basal body rod C-terminal domain-containing protein [Oceanibaculum nanhaiense]
MSFIDGIGSALSGAAAATNRFNVSANNVANIQSRGVAPEETAPPQQNNAQPEEEQGFQPLRAIDQSQEGGGVQSTTRPISPASIPVLQENPPEEGAEAQPGQQQTGQQQTGETGQEGVSFLPNVDPANEVVQQITSQRQFEANLRTLQTGLQLNQSLLDINS